METNELYVAVMYARKNDMNKVIRMFLVTPIKKYDLFSVKERIIGFKEAVTNIPLIRYGKDIKNRCIVWDILDRKAVNFISEDEINKYISKSNDEMCQVLNDANEEAIGYINSNEKRRTK